MFLLVRSSAPAEARRAGDDRDGAAARGTRGPGGAESSAAEGTGGGFDERRRLRFGRKLPLDIGKP